VIPTDFSNVRYLLSKKTVDDRALNAGVRAAFCQTLSALPNDKHLLELGAGVGTMLTRLSEDGSLASGSYTLVDQDGTSLEAAGAHITDWAKARGASVTRTAETLALEGSGLDLRVHLRRQDLFAFLETEATRRPYHAVLANAVLDLVDLSKALPMIWRACQPGASFWFTINFDGETILTPEEPFDVEVMRLYHRSMDERMISGTPAGHSQTGRRLLTAIPVSGAELSRAGASDWVVHPTASAYPADEAYFLHHIIYTIRNELNGNSELDQVSFGEWTERRHKQIERGTLSYIAHQLDFCGRAPLESA
jgi:hypothetical protein